jgi:hypothetical protein
MTALRDTLERLAAAGTTTAEALALFDALAPLPLDAMLGRWRGAGLATGHPLDGLLERFGWYGKEFRSAEDVQPLLFEAAGGEVYPVDPRFVPTRVLTDRVGVARLPALDRAFRRLGRLARATAPTARLRRIEHRGVVTATMIYDRLPICDVFRGADADAVLGVMDLRDLAQPFFFVLRRDRAAR